MKTLLTILFLLIAVSANAAISFTYPQSPVYRIMRQSGVLNYTDASPGWTQYNYAKFDITIGAGQTATITIPAITLTRSGGSETATATMACRTDQNSWPTTKAMYSACATHTAPGGHLYTSLFLTGVTFNADVTGVYNGNLIVTVNY